MSMFPGAGNRIYLAWKERKPGVGLQVQIKRNKRSTSMNLRDALELMFWIPVGLLSFAYLLLSSNELDINNLSSTNNDIAAAGNSIENITYNLVENTTIQNSYGDNCRVLRYAAQSSSVPVSTLQWAELLSEPSSSDERILQFTAVLADAPMKAFFFETKGVTYSQSRTQPFEFALVESFYLYQFADAKQDPLTFDSRFQECREKNDKEKANIPMAGCVFPNPRGDSVLIAPLEDPNINNTNVYGHMAAFLRRAPKHQITRFWKLVMDSYIERIKAVSNESADNTVWFSTDGTGVAWLHVRLDPIPKYYDYQPYVKAGSRGSLQ